MKTIISFFVLLPHFLFCQQWSIVGSRVSYTAVNYTFIATDNNDIPYVGFNDSYNYNRLTVKKFDGNAWVAVGDSGFSDGEVNSVNMVFDKENTLYVCYNDVYNGHKATVVKYDGANWISVGNPGFTDSIATCPFLALDSSGTPYVAFRDFSTNWAKISVMKFNGTDWVHVGTPGFSKGDAMYISMSIDNNGTPYVGYWDVPNDYMVIKKFNGSSWVNVGAPGFAEWTAWNEQAIAFDNNNVPYVVCSIAGKAAVMKFDGNNWVPVGSHPVSEGIVGFTSIEMDSNGLPYIAYWDGAYGGKSVVKKFDGEESWITIGTAGFTPSEAYDLSFVLDKKNTPYVAFEDLTPHYVSWANGSFNPGYVMKFESGLSTELDYIDNENSFSVFPNPAQESFQINYSSPEKGYHQVRVVNAVGEVLYSEVFQSCYEKSVSVEGMPLGMYFIEIIADDRRRLVKKVVVR